MCSIAHPTTPRNRPTDDCRYSIVESCMRPSGAYASTQRSFTDEAEARAVFATAYFVGPGYGILWGKTLTLRQGSMRDGRYESTVLAERDVD
jgi:hypothetical protein